MFSSRVPGNLEQNRIARAVRRARGESRSLIDLTVTNPTAVGLAYPDDMLRALASAEALVYSPQAFGLPAARAAVCAVNARRGAGVDTLHKGLTASTSEAYSTLFKLLCAPSGDAVLVPTPSYPLFEHLTALDGVEAIPYRLDFHGRWMVAFDDLDRGWTGRVRAVLAVSPNNPTGSTLSPEEVDDLEARCADRGAALIIDEVFADYPLTSEPLSAEQRIPDSETRQPRCLTFRLGGLSKSAGLPQVKLGWIAVQGPAAPVRSALDRLEVICDAYLSVSTPVQVAAPSLISHGARVREAILARVRENHAALAALAAAHPAVQLLPAEAGWSAVLRVPSTRSEEELVIDLLDRDGVLVHPGFFFDFPHEAFLVVSLLPEPREFAAGARTVMERASA
jgi:aspartate/methionine/tyrosine aminotransferase